MGNRGDPEKSFKDFLRATIKHSGEAADQLFSSASWKTMREVYAEGTVAYFPMESTDVLFKGARESTGVLSKGVLGIYLSQGEAAARFTYFHYF